jgi:hypothetical protein
MLFMVIEQFKNGDAAPIGERFRKCGRMMPEGVVYQGRWDDLVDLEVIPVVTSAEFWT